MQTPAIHYSNADVLGTPPGEPDREVLLATRCDTLKVTRCYQNAERMGWTITRVIEMDGDLSAFGPNATAR